MPNASNVNSPFCLVGAGRSGTTLVTAALRKHSQLQAIGETGNLVYSTFHTVERSLPLCGQGYDVENASAAARFAVTRMLIRLFPSELPYWFHKPIMVPEARRHFPEDADFFVWYWRVNRLMFPKGRWFTVVRDWRDVATSSIQRWGWTDEVAVRSEIRLHQMLLHRQSRVGFVLSFEDLTQDPEPAMQRLLAFLGLPFEPRVMTAFEKIHAPNVEAGDKDTIEALRQRGFRHEAAASLKSAELDDLHDQLRQRAAEDRVRSLAPVPAPEAEATSVAASR